MRQHRGRSVSLSLVVVAILAGCGQATEDTDGAPAPDWFAERTGMPVCGTFTFDDYMETTDELAEAVACLLEAFETGEPAELTITDPTDEGDPVTTVYQVVEPQRLLVLTDWTRDTFAGDKSFTRQECTRLEKWETHRPRPASCSTTAEI